LKNRALINKIQNVTQYSIEGNPATGRTCCFGTKSREKYRYSSVNLHSSDGPPNRQNGSKTPSIRTSQKADEPGEKYYTTVSNSGSSTKEVLPIKTITQ
jgi:hypothetical protein